MIKSRYGSQVIPVAVLEKDSEIVGVRARRVSDNAEIVYGLLDLRAPGGIEELIAAMEGLPTEQA